MNYLLWDTADYHKLYDCSMLSDYEWEQYKEPNVVIGTIYIVTATFYQICYIPFLIVMLKHEFIQHSAYKIMFYLGIIDVLATIIGGTICGIFYIRGDIFCTNEKFLFVVSIFTASFWIASCITGFLLVVTRIFDLVSSRISLLLFGGKKTCIWLIIPTLFALYSIFFTKPFLFNSIEGALFLSPYAGVDVINVDPLLYDNFFTIGVNIFIVTTFPILYTILPIVIRIKARNANNAKISSVQKQMIMQSLIIYCFILVTAIIYIYIQYLPSPHFLHIICHFCWQASHGGAVFAFIFINRSMKQAIFKMLKEKKVSFKGVSSKVFVVNASIKT